MRLAGPRSFLELDVLDYEYAPSSPLPTDRNLLLIMIHSGWHHHQSTRSVPALHTWELVSLIDWLEQLLTANRPLGRLQFTEPCFGIECVSCVKGEYLLQFQLAYEAAPAWHHDPGKPFWLPILANSTQLHEAVYTLKAQSAKFPVRP